MAGATIEELNALIAAQFPQVGEDYVLDALPPMGARLRLLCDEKHLRPGGTVSGPAMFALADLAMYFAVMGAIGPEALTVTTNCAIDFMRKPASGVDLLAECRLHKVGKVLAVGDVMIHSEGTEEPVARASLTYAIPPKG